MKQILTNWRHDAIRHLLPIACCFCQLTVMLSPAWGRSGAVLVQGPGVAPQLGFACCDQGIGPMQTLFADPAVIGDLSALHAQVAVAIADFSLQRAAVVERLNQAEIPTIAWILLPKDQGVYLNADNASAAVARVTAFEKWTSDNHLQWASVGLDIEPNFVELGAPNSHRWRLFDMLLRHAFDAGRIHRANRIYSTLIHNLQSRGYTVQTYQMPYMPAERSVGSNLLDRMLGTVDVRGSLEYLMLYTNVAGPVGAAMIWSLGGDAQAIGIGSTFGNSAPGLGSGPLNWNEFSRDLIVASHFTRQIGIYDLEGCVRRGFLKRLLAFDWSQSAVIPAASIARAERLGLMIRSALWIASHLLWLICAIIFLLAGLAWLWRERRHVRMSR